MSCTLMTRGIQVYYRLLLKKHSLRFLSYAYFGEWSMEINDFDQEESYYPLANSTWDQEEFASIDRVVKSGKFTMGFEVQKYEEEFASHVGARYSVMSNSGSSANLLMLAGIKYCEDYDIEEGDSVIVPAVSWSTTYFPIHQLGFTLSFVDIELDTLNIDLSSVLNAINNNTKAILAVNLLGNPANLIALKQIAHDNNLILIEDNCESMGAKLNNQFTGTFGAAGSYSSFFSHHISTMEGGMTTTDNLSLYETMKSLRAHGWLRDLPTSNTVHNKSGNEWEDSYKFVLPGYNLRPLEIEGAIGRSQIQKLSNFVYFRRENANYLNNLKHRFPDIKIQTENGESSWFGFSLVLGKALEGKRSLLIAELNKSGIESRPIVAGNFALNPVMKHLRHDPLPNLTNSTYIHNNGLFVGNHHYNIFRQLDVLVNILEKFNNENI